MWNSFSTVAIHIITALDTRSIKVESNSSHLKITMLCLQAVLLSERISGKGIVTALNMATGVPIWEIEPFLGVIVVIIFAVGLYPAIKKVPNPEEDTAMDSFQVTSNFS